MPKRKKPSNKRKKRDICLDSPTNSQENGGKDGNMISSGIEKTDIDRPVKGKRVQSKIGRNGGWSGKNESSSSSSDEESRSKRNLSERNVGKSVGRISVSEPIADPIERVELVTEMAKVLSKATPDEIPKVEGIKEATPVEKPEITQVTKTDSARNSDLNDNSGITRVSQAKVIKNSGNVPGVDSSDAVSEKPRESALGKEETQIVSALPPARPTSWKYCCGLFELLTGSNR